MVQKRTKLNETDHEQKQEGNKHTNKSVTEARRGRGTE